MIDMKDYTTFGEAITSFPAYFIDQDHFLSLLKKKMEDDHEVAEKKEILEVLYLLHELNRDYHTAFHILVRM